MKPLAELSPAERANLFKVMNRTKYIMLGSIIGLCAVLIALLWKLA